MKKHNFKKVSNTKNLKAEKPIFYLNDFLPIQKEEITMISGKGGTGKSFVAIWLSAMLTKKEKLKVFSYLSEDSVVNSKYRFDILKQKNRYLEGGDFDLFGKDSCPQSFVEKIDGSLKASTYWFNFISFFAKYDVIILDPLIAFLREDENNNIEARFLFNLINEWCISQHKTIIILHHHNKNNEIRGATSFVDSVRLHYSIHIKKDNENSRFLKLEKKNHYRGKDEFEIKLFQKDVLLNNSDNSIEIDINETFLSTHNTIVLDTTENETLSKKDLQQLEALKKEGFNFEG